MNARDMTLQEPARLAAEVPVRFVPAGTPADDGGALVLANTVDVESVRDAVASAPAVTLDFPKWVDGRAYSQAHVLRARLRYTGEIRATGDVTVDMLPLLVRCGFTAVQLREGLSEESARRALTFFPAGHYQGDVLEPRPRFARRAEEASA